MWTQTLLNDYFSRICFVHTRRPRTAWRTSHKPNELSRATLCATCENRVAQFHKPFFRLPQSGLQASTKRTYTRPFSNGTPPSQLRTNWIGIKWRTCSRLERTASATRCCNVYNLYTYKFFSPNLDESREWPRGPSKSRNPSESLKIPILTTMTMQFWLLPEKKKEDAIRNTDDYISGVHHSSSSASPAISLGFTILGWDCCVCDCCLIQPLK